MILPYKLSRTIQQRRWIVVLYYLLVLAYVSIYLWRGKWPFLFLPINILTALTIGGLLGGLNAGGFVKAFSRPIIVPEKADPVWSPVSYTPNPKPVWTPLDERERNESNEAHHAAYRILRWALFLGSIAYWLGLLWAPLWLTKRSPALLWLLVVFVLSLPQVVILWTEMPDPEE